MLTYPLFSTFEGSHAVLGIPLLYVYVFAVWAVFIPRSAQLIPAAKPSFCIPCAGAMADTPGEDRSQHAGIKPVRRGPLP
jgi:hypothetical protein